MPEVVGPRQRSLNGHSFRADPERACAECVAARFIDLDRIARRRAKRAHDVNAFLSRIRAFGLRPTPLRPIN